MAVSRASSTSTCSGEAPFCGPNARAAPRSPSSGFLTSQSTWRSRRVSESPTTSSSPAPPSTVAVSPRPTRIEPDVSSATESRSSPRPRLEAVSGSSSSSDEEPQPDRLGRLDHSAAVSEHEEPRPHRPADRIRRGGLTPLASERGGEHLGRPFAAVGDRKLVGVEPRAVHPCRERHRSLDRRQDALAASGRRERAHGAAPRPALRPTLPRA